MTQSIYTSVSNADVVPCGKKGQKIQSQAVPLVKTKYLSEFRTALEKAKVRANLGIGDAYNLLWGNITGRLEDNAALVQFILNLWKYNYSSQYIDTEITTVKDALDYALYYVSTFEANDEAVTAILTYITQLQNTILPGLELSIEDGDDAIKELIEGEDGINEKIADITDVKLVAVDAALEELNTAIEELNSALAEINVDDNILAWVKASLEGSTSIELEEGEDTNILKVKISQAEGNGVTVKDDGVFVQDFSDKAELIDDLADDVAELQQNLTYQAQLPDSTSSPSLEGLTVGDLKNKSLSQIVDTLFFPATVRALVMPTLTYQSIPTLVEVNELIAKPRLTYTKGDAGETTANSNILTFNGEEVLVAIYANLGQYLWTGKYEYKAGEYLINNRGETTTSRVEAGAVLVTMNIEATYPWYAGNTVSVTKLDLVPFNTMTDDIIISLDGEARIELPGENSVINSFEVNSGLGFQAVNMTDWTKSTTTKNGITYLVWTKNSEYYSILEHKIKFKLVL